MMNKINSSLGIKTVLHTALTVAMLFAFTLQGFAQTAAGTDIKNQASATYDDGSGNNYSTVSNEVTVTVAKVAGLTITPDAQTNTSVVPGQTGVTMDFLVTNTGNFTDQVRFLANGGSFQIPTGMTATAAVIDPTGTPIDILTNGSSVLHSLAAGGSVTVRVTLSISASATAGSTLQVFLGDQTTLTPTFDNDAADSSASEVNTVSTGAVNGSREARGDISVAVQDDAQIRVNLTAPAGPVNIGSDITYTTSVCNDGARDLDPFDPDGVGSMPSAVWVFAPIPAGTELTNVAGLPAGTFFSTTALTTAPLSATWTATAPGTLSTVTRIAIPVSSTAIASGGTCTGNFTFDVTVTATDANTPIYEIVDAFGANSIGTTITDQSGDNTPNEGDGNANFDEPIFGGTDDPTQGFQLPTLLTKAYEVLNGTNGNAGATGPTDNDDDFTNLSVNTGIAGVAPGGVTTASGTVTFTNTLQNTGNADDTFRLTTPTVPAGSTVEIFDGVSWIDVTNGTNFVDFAVPVGATANYLVRVTLPAGLTVLTGYDTVVRATSQNDNTKTTDTIDRVYTGFIRLNKTATVANGTGVGGATDAVPGAVITYVVTYTNVSEASGGGSLGLTASNLVVTEDGNAAPNNWGSTTTRVVGQEFDYLGATGTTAGTGTVVVVSATSYTDTIPTLAPGGIGRFVFERTID